MQDMYTQRPSPAVRGPKPYSNLGKSPRLPGPAYSARYTQPRTSAAWRSLPAEIDDDLHDPDARSIRRFGSILSLRGIGNIGCIIILALSLLILFAGIPVITYIIKQGKKSGVSSIGGTNANGEFPEIPGMRALIDRDTPQEAYKHTSLEDGSEWDLVFSDEFNTEGRSFYPGDDPYWEAVDLHYWGTDNLEWYSPDMITTSGGFLNITLAQTPWRGMNYKGGMLQSWNKFCFTGGYFVANVSLPGRSDVYGLWPAVWAMGNLGRAGYGATLDGTWPYSYDTCDVGTLPNQTRPDGTPTAATQNGDPAYGGVLSYLPGQRLSACTCSGESHPGPKRSDGTFVGRSAPEIDILEATVDTTTRIGHVSMSGQWAPFNYAYQWNTSAENYQIYQQDGVLNPYVGGVYQMTTSGLMNTNQNCYTQGGGCFAVYGFEYKPGTDGYIAWVNDNNPSWTLRGSGMGPDPRVEIGARPIPQEPMYMIVNLGISAGFGGIDLVNLVFPSTMLVDWIRVYQPKGARNIGCDPPDYPTAEYIQQYSEAYSNYNLTTWVDDYKQTIPKNRLVDGCV